MFDSAQKWCTNVFHPFAKEFQLKKFSLKHQPIDDFAKSQWQKGSRSLCWLIYRWLLAAFFIAVVCDTMINLFYAGKWFIYLTAWGFFLCMLTSLYGAIIVSIYYWRPHDFAAHPIVFKMYWVSYWTTLVLATVITLVYWSLLYPYDKSGVSLTYNLLGHASNSILMVLDHMLVAFPTRIFHFVYPIGMGVIYVIFSLIYYFAGGVDTHGDHYIYTILDWAQPETAVITIIICFALLAIMSFLLFGLYKLRCFIYRKINKSVLVLQV
ncbi:protein rolling stone-like [Bactrocera neohumeralis]|uniref:protein rolling stone-like n=1 Tax=Bactrocera tryoni TaxID=59916 RepID=UPI001A97A46B|nr:protein rolling stone-like [Bactrocera tryoni]XP_050319596.1 protein rolling stone-like [Bactrocera neohumeralis]